MTLADEHHGRNLRDHAAPLKRDCSWALFRRTELTEKDDPKQKIPVMLYYDPLTRGRLKESKLPEGWRRSYEEAMEALESSWGHYHGIAFLLTHEDPYHLTVVKGGGWALQDKDYNDPGWAMYHREMHDRVVEFLEEQSTYAFHAPFGSDIYLIGRAKRPENRYKKCGWMLKFESYDGGWDKTQKKFTPKFVPFSEKVVNGYDVPITDVQDWVEDWVEDCIPRKGRVDKGNVRDEVIGELSVEIPNKSFVPPKKVARVKPMPVPPANAMPIVGNMRCAKWAYENPQLVEDEECSQGSASKWKWDRFARSPKTGEKILWGEDNFEETKHLWGLYNPSCPLPR